MLLSDKVGQNRFSTIKQTGSRVVLRQRQLHLETLAAGQAWARQQILVDTNGLFYFTTFAKHAAQGQTGVNRVVIRIQGLYKYINGLICLLIKQVVKTHKVLFGRLTGSLGLSFSLITPAKKISNDHCHQHQGKQCNIRHPLTLSGYWSAASVFLHRVWQASSSGCYWPCADESPAPAKPTSQSRLRG